MKGQKSNCQNDFWPFEWQYEESNQFDKKLDTMKRNYVWDT